MVKLFTGSVFVQGDFGNAMTKSMFRKRGFTIAPDVPSADVVVWTGGCDISPELYGEKPVHSNGISRARDKEDIAVASAAVLGKKFLVGLCRGAQLLNVWPNKGTLWQDVDLHGSRDHVIQDAYGKRYNVNSLHHQMMKMGPNGQMIAWCMISGIRRSELVKSVGIQRDPEVIWYPASRSLCVQFHPEFIHPESTAYFFELMERYYEGKTDTAEECVHEGPPWEDTPAEVANVIAQACDNDNRLPRPEVGSNNHEFIDDEGEAVEVYEASSECVDFPCSPA